MPQAGGADGSVAPDAPLAVGSKRVLYRGKHYDIPLWMSASTFEKRMRSGMPFAEASRKPPLSAAGSGRRGRRASPFDKDRAREIAVEMAKKAVRAQRDLQAAQGGLQGYDPMFRPAAAAGGSSDPEGR